MTPPAPATLHATAIVVDGRGVLIRGEAGSGKSSLAQRLIDRAGLEDRVARLVCDDRVAIVAEDGRLVARAVPAIAGLIELRGIGIVRVPYEPEATIGLVVDLGEIAARLPERADAVTRILGVEISRIAVNGPLALELVWWRLRYRDDTVVTVS